MISTGIKTAVLSALIYNQIINVHSSGKAISQCGICSVQILRSWTCIVVHNLYPNEVKGALILSCTTGMCQTVGCSMSTLTTTRQRCSRAAWTTATFWSGQTRKESPILLAPRTEGTKRPRHSVAGTTTEGLVHYVLPVKVLYTCATNFVRSLAVKKGALGLQQ